MQLPSSYNFKFLENLAWFCWNSAFKQRNKLQSWCSTCVIILSDLLFSLVNAEVEVKGLAVCIWLHRWLTSKITFQTYHYFLCSTSMTEDSRLIVVYSWTILMMTSFYLEKWLNNSPRQDRSEIGHGNQKREKSCKILTIRSVACLTPLKSECFTDKF